MISVQKIGLAGISDAVDGSVAQAQTGLGPFFFKGKDALIVCVNGGEQGEIILYIPAAVKCIFRQQDRELGLDPQRGG